MTDQDRSNDALEIEILRADLESTRAEWFKQQREWAEREQEQARRLAATEKRAKVAMKYARHTWDCRSPCSCGFADVLASGAQESLKEEGK